MFLQNALEENNTSRGGTSACISPIKRVNFAETCIFIDTDGGNSTLPVSLLHSKIQHREKVMKKVEEYLRTGG